MLSIKVRKQLARERARNQRHADGSRPSIEADVRKVIIDELQTRTKSLYEDPRYTDLTIKCGDRSFKVHKAIVCAGCEVFQAACKNDERGAFREGVESVITLSSDVEDGGDEPAVISWLIQYLYQTDYYITSEYPGPPEFPIAAHDNSLTTHAKMFAVADKCNIRGLKLLAEHKFKTAIQESGVAFQDLASSIPVVFTRTPETVNELRDVLKEYLVKAVLSVTNDSDVRSAVESIDGLSFELFQKMKERATGLDAASVNLSTGEMDFSFLD